MGWNAIYLKRPRPSYGIYDVCGAGTESTRAGTIAYWSVAAAPAASDTAFVAMSAGRAREGMPAAPQFMCAWCGRVKTLGNS